MILHIFMYNVISDFSAVTPASEGRVNKAYLGSTGMYLDRAGHMLAFYGRKGSTRAGLIQEVAIEAS